MQDAATLHTFTRARRPQLYVFSFQFVANLRIHFAECRSFTYTLSSLCQVYVYTLQSSTTSHILLPFYRKFTYRLCRVPQLHIYSFHFIASLRI